MKKLMYALMLAALVALIGCSSGGGSHHNPPSGGGGGSTSSGWIIGPIIKGKNSSVGMPTRPTLEGSGWNIALPGPGGHVHYVQNFNPPSLVGAKSIVMVYTVTGGGFMPQGGGATPAKVGLQFQRNGDDWSGKGSKQYYRWYSKSRPNLKAGEFTLTVPLEMQAWHDVYGKSDYLGGFDAAVQDLDNIAVVFGGQFAGHGVYATEPSRFTLVSLTVER